MDSSGSRRTSAAVSAEAPGVFELRSLASRVRSASASPVRVPRPGRVPVLPAIDRVGPPPGRSGPCRQCADGRGQHRNHGPFLDPAPVFQPPKPPLHGCASAPLIGPHSQFPLQAGGHVERHRPRWNTPLPPRAWDSAGTSRLRGAAGPESGRARGGATRPAACRGTGGGSGTTPCAGPAGDGEFWTLRGRTPTCPHGQAGQPAGARGSHPYLDAVPRNGLPLHVLPRPVIGSSAAADRQVMSLRTLPPRAQPVPPRLSAQGENR